MGFAVALFTGYRVYFFTDLFFNPPVSVNSDPDTGDWTMFRRDLAHTGATIRTGSQPRGVVSWTYKTGAPIHSSPADVNNVVYFGSQDSRLYALDAKDGSLIWMHEDKSWIQSSPAVVDGVVYFGTNAGNIRALNADTGSSLWVYESRYAVVSSPAVADDQIYIGTTEGALLVLDAATGRKIWSSNLGGSVLSSPAVANGLVFVGATGRYFHVLHAKDGRTRMRFYTMRTVLSTPAIAGGSVYFATSAGRLFSIDGTARSVPMEHRLRRLFLRMRIIGLPAPAATQQSGHRWALDVGEWSNSSPLITGNSAYIGADNKLVAVDVRIQSTRWEFVTEGVVRSSPALAGDLVVVGSDDGRIYAVKAATGALEWSIETGAEVTSSPAVSDGTVFVGSHDGMLYAIK